MPPRQRTEKHRRLRAMRVELDESECVAFLLIEESAAIRLIES
jgi:hypothetical protein